MPAATSTSQLGPACWELRIKLIPRDNDPLVEEFRKFLGTKGLMIDKNHGWSACGYHCVTILVTTRDRAEEAEERIKKWAEENLPS